MILSCKCFCEKRSSILRVVLILPKVTVTEDLDDAQPTKRALELPAASGSQQPAESDELPTPAKKALLHPLFTHLVLALRCSEEVIDRASPSRTCPLNDNQMTIKMLDCWLRMCPGPEGGSKKLTSTHVLLPSNVRFLLQNVLCSLKMLDCWLRTRRWK